MTAVTRALLVLALCAAASSAAFAQGAPATVSFVARLQDAGLPLMGSHDFVFALYDQPTGGTKLWEEARPQLALQDGGLLYVDLGTVTALTSSVFGGNARYLEVTLDGTVSQPRVLIESVPYSLRAGKASDADALQGHPSSFFQQTVQNTCTGLASIQTINGDGTVTCATPPTYTNGTGLLLASGVFSVDYGATQARITGTCLTGAINVINGDGSVTCASIPNYTAGSGISIASNQIAVDFTVAQHALTSTCLPNALLNTFTAAGGPACYQLGSGLQVATNTVSVDTSVVQPRTTVALGKSTSVTTNSQTYTAIGPSATVTIPSSGNAMITVTALVTPPAGGAYMSFSGGGITASDTQALFVTSTTQASATYYVNNIASGPQTISAAFRQGGGPAGSATWANAQIIVVPLP